MFDDPTKPADYSPPRTVQPWTRVSGHVIAGAASSTPFCSCGERWSTKDDCAPKDWRDRHLATAWPELVPRLASEDLSDWMARVSDALVEASRVEYEIEKALGMDRPVEPGQPFPVVTMELTEAGERTRVLDHQLRAIRERISPHPQ